MTVYELLKSCDYRKTEEKLKLHYSCKTKAFRKLYHRLVNTRFSPCTDDFYVYISVYRDNGDEYIYTEDFSEDDTTLFFDVSGYNKAEDTVYSIAGSSYIEFLNFLIDKKTLKNFTPEIIAAHLLYEITFFGFRDNK